MSAATAVRDQLARTMGAQVAAAWMHTLAVARHAEQTGWLAGVLTADADPVTIARRAADTLAGLHPGIAGFADPAVNPAMAHQLTAYEAAEILAWVRGVDLWPNRDRTDGYAVGDLYQELSDEARKGRALCQTPKFVTDLLLDLSLRRAAEEYGWNGLRMIDPACGTGHILIEAFISTCVGRRTTRSSRDPWRPCGNETFLEQLYAALGTVHGVDLDPYAVLVARYRLLALARTMLRANRCDNTLPADLPLNVVAADSLLDEDEPLLARGRYHAVVANPPYIVCSDKTQLAAIRARWGKVCSGKFGLYVPFEPLMHELAVPGGWVTRITSNAFMKREYGKALIEKFLGTVDLQWLIDTSGAYIPGHGTPTVIMSSRNRPPVRDKIHAVMGKKGEPSAPADPARGGVWSSIARYVREVEAFDRLGRSLERLAGEQTPPAQPEPAPIPQPRTFTQQSLLDLVDVAS